MRCLLLNAVASALFTLSGCGTYVPQIQEVWEGLDVTGDMEQRIKENIFCETVDALRNVRSKIFVIGQPAIPDSFGLQMQITLTVEEASALNPGVTFNEPLRSAIRHGTSFAQSFSLSPVKNA